MAHSQQLVKGVTQLYGRLFDHHAVVQTEINHMKEFDKILQSSERSSEISVDSLQSVRQSLTTCESELPRLHDVLSAIVNAKQIADSVLHSSETQPESELLIRERASRVERWKDYMNHMCERSAQVDSKYQLQADALKKHYEDAEDKLNLNAVSAPVQDANAIV